MLAGNKRNPLVVDHKGRLVVDRYDGDDEGPRHRPEAVAEAELEPVLSRLRPVVGVDDRVRAGDVLRREPVDFEHVRVDLLDDPPVRRRRYDREVEVVWRDVCV